MHSTIFIRSNIEEVKGNNKIVHGVSCDMVHRINQDILCFQTLHVFIHFSSNLDTIRYRRAPRNVIKHL